jgi:Domain of unknown function (DUF2019)
MSEKKAEISLVELYRTAAEAHAEAIQRGDHVDANAAADRIAAIYAELKRRGIEHQSKLLALLSDTSAGVRLWSASHALEFAAPLAQETLEQLSRCRNHLGFSARMTLNMWRAGTLQFPS